MATKSRNAIGSGTTGATDYLLVGPFEPGARLQSCTLLVAGSAAGNVEVALAMQTRNRADAGSHANGRSLLDRSNSVVNGKPSMFVRVVAGGTVAVSFGLFGSVVDEPAFVIVAIVYTSVGAVNVLAVITADEDLQPPLAPDGLTYGGVTGPQSSFLQGAPGRFEAKDTSAGGRSQKSGSAGKG